MEDHDGKNGETEIYTFSDLERGGFSNRSARNINIYLAINLALFWHERG
jgi:hypothetical protein